MKDKIIAKTKYIKFVLRTAGNGRMIPVIKVPPGGMIIPYFQDRGKWNVVLVSQYRPTVKKETLEAPGGIVNNGETEKEALSRELKEETGIKVTPRLIKIVICEYLHPPCLDVQLVGAIVKISAIMVKNKKIAGKKSENEKTRVEIFNLVDLLKKRKANKIIIDLMTARLIDEVAKTTGLLKRNY